jgi:hypothetical protein
MQQAVQTNQTKGAPKALRATHAQKYLRRFAWIFLNRLSFRRESIFWRRFCERTDISSHLISSHLPLSTYCNQSGHTCVWSPRSPPFNSIARLWPVSMSSLVNSYRLTVQTLAADSLQSGRIDRSEWRGRYLSRRMVRIARGKPAEGGQQQRKPPISMNCARPQLGIQ